MVGDPLTITSLLALASPGQRSTGQGFLSKLLQDGLQVFKGQRLPGPGAASRRMVSNGRQFPEVGVRKDWRESESLGRPTVRGAGDGVGYSAPEELMVMLGK